LSPAENPRPLGQRLSDLALNAALVVTLGMVLVLLVSAAIRAVTPGHDRDPSSRAAAAGMTDAPVDSRLTSEKTPATRGGRDIRVQVLNGCGVPGAGSGMASVLRLAGGLDVVEIGNADQFDFDSSLVLDRTGNSAFAERVAQILNGAPVLRQRQAEARSDVTVIVGYDRGRWLEPLPAGGGR
jgi:hypothetical protein